MCMLLYKSSHHPNGEIADALALILACATATDALVNCTGGAYCRDVESSHRPDGKTADVLALILALVKHRMCVQHRD
jgi:hypothetical protein